MLDLQKDDKDLNPLALFSLSCGKQDPKMSDDFLSMIRHLYQFQIFKGILDLSATKIYEKALSFKLFNQRFFDLDEGNCKTIFGSKINKIFNTIRPKNIYQITIKKLSYEVIIHEIAHMVEKEVQIELPHFIASILQEINKPTQSQGLRNKIQTLFVDELQPYPSNQKGSEFFARYFQFLCASKDIAGLSGSGHYSLTQAFEHFEYTTKLVNEVCVHNLKETINHNIAMASACFIKKIDEIEHKWSEQKIHSIHGKGPKKWGNAIQSIKNNEGY